MVLQVWYTSTAQHNAVISPSNDVHPHHDATPHSSLVHHATASPIFDCSSYSTSSSCGNQADPPVVEEQSPGLQPNPLWPDNPQALYSIFLTTRTNMRSKDVWFFGETKVEAGVRGPME